MRKISFSVLLYILFTVAASAAGVEKPGFWESPDTRLVDANGNLVQAEIKDRVNFTARVFQNGSWLTYHYAPRTEQILKIEAPDTTDEILYDAGGQEVGLTVHVGELALTVRYGDGRISADGLVPIVKERDEWQRDIGVVTETGTPIAEIGVNHSGNVSSLTLGDGNTRYSVVSQGKARYLQTLRGPKNFHVLDRLVVADGGRRNYPFWLDPVARELGLTESWKREVHGDMSTTGYLLSIRRNTGELLLYVVRVGPDKVAFDRKGSAVFYDLTMFIYGYPATDVDRWPELQTTFPDHIVYARDGSIGAYIWQPSVDGIIGFWNSRTEAGTTATSVRYGFAPADASANAQDATSVKSSESKPVPNRR